MKTSNENKSGFTFIGSVDTKIKKSNRNKHLGVILHKILLMEPEIKKTVYEKVNNV